MISSSCSADNVHSAANSSASFSFFKSLSLYSTSSKKMSFLPCFKMWPASWKKVNQKISFRLYLPVNWINGVSLIHLVEPFNGAFGKQGVCTTLTPASAHIL